MPRPDASVSANAIRPSTAPAVAAGEPRAEKRGHQRRRRDQRKQAQVRRVDGAGSRISGERQDGDDDRIGFDRRAPRLAFPAAQSHPDRRWRGGEATQTADGAADDADECVGANSSGFDARGITDRQRANPIERQQRPDRQPKAQRIGIVQQEDAKRNAERAADHERRDARRSKPPRNGKKPTTCAEQRAEHRERRGELPA